MLLAWALTPAPSVAQNETSLSWNSVQAGLDHALIHLSEKTPAGNSTLILVRLNPAQWTPSVFTRSEEENVEYSLTALEWAFGGV